MRGLVEVLAQTIDSACHRDRCGKAGCWMSMEGVPVNHLLVDVDCDALQKEQTGPRADYLFVAEEEVVWVVPMELKSGRLDVEHVLKQLRGTAVAAEEWIPAEQHFRLMPVLAHRGRSLRAEERKMLGRTKITLHGRSAQTLLCRCGSSLAAALT